MSKNKYIKTPEILLDLFFKYKKWAKENPIKKNDFKGKDAVTVYYELERPLTMEGFENFVADIPNMPMSLDQYFCNKDNAYDDYFAICSRIKRLIREDQITGGMAGIYNPSITQRLNNLVDKTDVTTKGESINIVSLGEGKKPE